MAVPRYPVAVPGCPVAVPRYPVAVPRYPVAVPGCRVAVPGYSVAVPFPRRGLKPLRGLENGVLLRKTPAVCLAYCWV
ncbi:MAG: hypothetical protein LBL31_07275 [Spirochaetaceae bacterium]|nr:hypothetical protein [Spirochaetaceae bacterium]